MYSK
jgi:RHS repeat-associated protein